jgi:hypothetical protein
MLFRFSGVAAVPDRRGGRPRIADGPAGREDMIRIVKLVLLGALLVKEAAGAARVSRTTIWRRIREFLADGKPDTDDIRALHDDFPPDTHP